MFGTLNEKRRPIDKYSAANAAGSHACAARLEMRYGLNVGYADSISLRRPAAVGRLPAYANSGWPAMQFTKLDWQKAGIGHQPLTLHSGCSAPRRPRLLR